MTAMLPLTCCVLIALSLALLRVKPSSGGKQLRRAMLVLVLLSFGHGVRGDADVGGYMGVRVAGKTFETRDIPSKLPVAHPEDRALSAATVLTPLSTPNSPLPDSTSTYSPSPSSVPSRQPSPPPQDKASRSYSSSYGPSAPAPPSPCEVKPLSSPPSTLTQPSSLPPLPALDFSPVPHGNVCNVAAALPT